MPDKKLESDTVTLTIRCRAYEKLLKSLDRESVANRITREGLHQRIKNLERRYSELGLRCEKLVKENRILMCKGSSDEGPDRYPGGLKHPLDM